MSKFSGILLGQRMARRECTDLPTLSDSTLHCEVTISFSCISFTMSSLSPQSASFCSTSNWNDFRLRPKAGSASASEGSMDTPRAMRAFLAPDTWLFNDVFVVVSAGFFVVVVDVEVCHAVTPPTGKVCIEK